MDRTIHTVRIKRLYMDIGQEDSENEVIFEDVLGISINPEGQVLLNLKSGEVEFKKTEGCDTWACFDFEDFEIFAKSLSALCESLQGRLESTGEE